jgi:hypothetical protein
MKKLLFLGGLVLVALILGNQQGGLLQTPAPSPPQECQPKEYEVRNMMQTLRTQGYSGQELIDLTASLSKVPCDLVRESQRRANQPKQPLPPELQALIKK